MQRRSRRILATALAPVAALAVAGCGGSDDPEKVSAAGLTVEAPSGWQVQEEGNRGLVIAEEESDLSGAAPTGARFTARPDDGRVQGPDEIVSSVNAAKGTQMIEPPANGKVAGRDAVSTLLRRQSGMQGNVFVALGPRRAYAFLLEAPVESWEKNVEKLNKILATAKFDVSAVPEAR